MHVDQLPGLIQKRRRVFVPQTEIDRHLRVDLPCVVDVVSLAHRPELDLGKCYRALIALPVTEQVFRERVPCAGYRGPRGSVGQTCRHIRLEAELTAREQVAQLVVLVPTQFAAEAQRMTPRRPTEVVDRLIDPVLVGVRTIDVAKRALGAR